MSVLSAGLTIVCFLIISLQTLRSILNYKTKRVSIRNNNQFNQNLIIGNRRYSKEYSQIICHKLIDKSFFFCVLSFSITSLIYLFSLFYKEKVGF